MTTPIRFLDNKDFDYYGNIVDMGLRGGKTVIMFYADSCKDCKEFYPVYQQLSKMNPDAKICMVSTLKNAKLMARLKKVFPFTVENTPTVISYLDGGFYSSYDYGHGERDRYRSLDDMLKYVDGIGKAKIVTK